MVGLLIMKTSAVQAYVGNAERYDEFKEAELAEFQKSILEEEEEKNLAQDQDVVKLLEEKKTELAEADVEERDAIDEEIAELRKELLNLPPRDLLRFETTGQHQYDTNINRKVPRQEKGDSVFDVGQTLRVDLSGRKTQLQFDTVFLRQWNIEFSEKDFWSVEERMRYRRQYFKKIKHSAATLVHRHSSKTIEIDTEKIRWDIEHSSSFNYPFSQKLSLNVSADVSKRLFTQEAFDQDSSHEIVFAPSAFWNFTPKSRASLGYRFGVSRIRSKTGDANSHEISAGYFGRVTRKSSASADIAFSFENPRSRDTAKVNTIKVGVGYIWQVTPKTQITTQYIHEIQNSTSNLTSGEVDGANTTSKQDTHFINDNLSIALNTRLGQKMSSKITLGASHLRTKVSNPLNEDVETRQFTFPATVELDYAIRRWIRLAVSYTFAFRTGDEKADTYRTHLWRSFMQLSF